MAQADLIAPPQFRTAAPKAKMTVYFALNIISFMAMLLACLFLYLEVRRFGGFGAVSGRVASIERETDTYVAIENANASLRI